MLLMSLQLLIDHSSLGLGVVGTSTQQIYHTSQFAWSIKLIKQAWKQALKWCA